MKKLAYYREMKFKERAKMAISVECQQILVWDVKKCNLQENNLLQLQLSWPDCDWQVTNLTYYENF